MLAQPGRGECLQLWPTPSVAGIHQAWQLSGADRPSAAVRCEEADDPDDTPTLTLGLCGHSMRGKGGVSLWWRERRQASFATMQGGQACFVAAGLARSLCPRRCWWQWT